MNTINVLIFLLAVFLASEAGHHERRHKFRERGAANSTNDEVEDDNSDWPNVAEVKHFKIPDVFTQAKSTRQADDEPEDNNEVHHHGRHHGVHHRH